MIDPLASLGIVRSMIRENGLLFIETAALFSDEYILKFNSKGTLYGQSSNYFLVSLTCLDYWLRMLRLRPIDCSYIRNNESEAGRVAIVCRAENTVINDDDDKWMSSKWVKNDFHSVGLNYENLKSTKVAVKYSPNRDHNLVFRDSKGTVNIYDSVINMKSYRIDKQKGILSL